MSNSEHVAGLAETVALCSLLLLTGCDPMPNKSSPQNVQKLANAMAYFKDSHGLCYATVSTASYGAFNVASIANVPCDKVGL